MRSGEGIERHPNEDRPMLTPDQVHEAARRLHRAEREVKQIRPISLSHPQLDMVDAYAIQKAWLDIKLAEGLRVIGHKIGLTSRAMQMAMQIDEPDFGTLLDDMKFEQQEAIDVSQFLDPRIEVELAFVLKEDLIQGKRAEMTVEQVLSATDYVAPSLEIIAARSHRVDPETGRPRRVFDTIADNAANAGILLGAERISPQDTDLRWVSALLYRNGIIEETGVAAGVLGHPARGIIWLARKLRDFGEVLQAGEIILSGSFTRPIEVREGDEFHADFGAFGSVGCRFH